MKDTVISALPTTRGDSRSLWQRLGRRALRSALERLEHGQITLEADGERLSFGQPTDHCPLAVTIDVRHPQFWADVAFGGTTGAGESYMRGHWSSSNLTDLVRIMVVNRELMNALEGGWALVSAPLRRLAHRMNRNSKAGSRRNIAAHYDLGNDFFRLFLDSTMAYSCGIFERPDATMYDASVAKFDAICRKLDLRPRDHLLEIGTGWGGFAIHAASHYGCRVTTTTISKEQYAWARERIAERRLEGRIELLLKDYRDLDGRYDKLVSIEMIEAVGHQYLDRYFAKLSSLLEPDGAMLLQAITIRDQLYEEALGSVDFIQRYVFPGSFIPSVNALSLAITRSSDMKIVHLEDIGPHYATTLNRWREAFFANLPAVRSLGYPEEFLRLWEFYLCYCEGGFLERQLGDVQMVLARPGCRL